MNVLFTEFEPSKALSSYIQTYWTGHFNIDGKSDFVQAVVPNGCIELIIHMTDEHCFLSRQDDNWNKSPVFTLIGLHPKAYDVRFDRTVKVFGIRFYPDGFRNIFGIPPAEFMATYEDGSEVLGKAFADFCTQIHDRKTMQEQVDFAELYMLKQLAKNRQSYDYGQQTMQIIRQAQGLGDFQQLIGQVPISLRQLQREFKNHYGLTITDYMRIARINAIHSYMLHHKHNLTALAYHLEFTDQSHFIREYKNFVGVTPGKFQKAQQDFIVNIG